jgi:hypothetical protein
MSKDNTQDDYEIGYGKPPKNSQFQKGISGNSRGRPQESLDFNHELIKNPYPSSLSMTMDNENVSRSFKA